MIRRILFVTVALIILALLAYFFIEWKSGKIKKVDAIQAVPTDAALIINASNLPGFIREELSRNKIWEELNALPSIGRIHERLSRMDTLLRTDTEISGLYRNVRASLSLHKSGKSNYEYMLYFPLENAGNEKQVMRFIVEGIQDGARISNRRYNEVRIYDVEFLKSGRQDNFSFAFSHGLLVISPSSILLEEAIRQMELQQSVADEPGFKEVAETAGRNVEGNIYLNFKALPDFVGNLLNERYAGRVADLLHFADWSELDANLRHNALLLNGFTYADSESDDFLNIVLKNQPQKLDIENLVPENVAAFLAMGIDDFSEYKKEYLRYLEVSGDNRSYLRDLKVINEKYGMDVDEIFLPVMSGQVALVVTDIRNYGWAENSFVICNTKSRSQAEEKLNEFLAIISEKDGISASSLIERRKVNNDITYTFYQVPVPFLPMKLFGRIFESVNSQYCTLYDNYLIFGNSIQALSKYIHANQLGNNLGSDLDFSQLSDYLATRSNLYFYLNIPGSDKLLERFLNPATLQNLKKQKEHFTNFQAIAYQLTSENNLAYNNIILKYSPELREEAQTVWESRLDMPLLSKPKLVLNHYTKEKEIFVQDAGKNIYLLNSSGRILWKQKIKGEILSDIYQIDYYKNGKLQLLFNTREQIHLLDRNGNNVERYPVELRSPATNGLALFDYEDNRDYRLFIATEDRGVNLYNKEGSLVKGWNFTKTESKVTMPLRHFRIENRDYLVFADQFTCYILNRKGDPRVRVQKHFPVSRNASFNLESRTTGVKPRLAITDSTGQVQFIYFDGTVEQVQVDHLSGDHYFEYQDLDGDGRREYIFVDQAELKVFNPDKSRAFSYSFKSPVSQAPVIYQFSSGNRKIGLVSADKHEIFLFNNDGSLYHGFPLRGSTPFSIGVFNSATSKFNLIVGSDDNFLYNYSVQ